MESTEACTTGAYTEFRYLLVRLGKQLHREDCEGLTFVHRIPKSHTAADIGLHVLSKLEAEGYFDPLSPEKLQEILSKIGRKDLAHDIKEYKQSSSFKKALKLEAEREKESKRKAEKESKIKWKKKGKDASRGEAFEERRVAANLLSGVELTTTHEERRWRDMFAMALTHTAQLVEQTELLRKAIQQHDDPDQTNKRIEEALASIETAQDEVESLSKTLKKAISAAGLKSRESRRASHDSQLTDSPGEEGPKDLKLKKQPMTPPHSPLTRRNTYDGHTRNLVTKTPASSLSTAHTSGHTPITHDGKNTPQSPILPGHTPTETAPNPVSSPSVPTAQAKSRSSTLPVKSKPLKMPEFQSKLDKMLAEGSPMTRPTTRGLGEASTTQPQVTPGGNNSTTTSSTLEEEHVYEDPNLPEEELDVYMNSSMVISSPSYQREKRVSNASNQEDSGFGHEDQSWGGELVNLKENSHPHYMNVKILTDEYAELQEQPAPTGGEYTMPSIKR